MPGLPSHLLREAKPARTLMQAQFSATNWRAQAAVLTSSLEESPVERSVFWGGCLPMCMLSPWQGCHPTPQMVLSQFPI